MRTSDVAIFNKSSFKLKCTSSKCDHGCYTSSLLPEQEISPKQSSVFGMESTGLTGLDCTTKYESDDGTYFEIKTKNPFIGSNSVKESNSPNLVLTHTLGSGNNNQVRWIVDDRNSNIRSESDKSNSITTLTHFNSTTDTTTDFNISSL